MCEKYVKSPETILSFSCCPFVFLCLPPMPLLSHMKTSVPTFRGAIEPKPHSPRPGFDPLFHPILT